MKKIMLLIVLLFANNIFAEKVEKEILGIEKIIIKNQKEVPEEIIKQGLELKINEKFQTGKMMSDYSKLKKSKYLSDVKIYPKINNGMIDLIIEIVEKENVKKILKADGIIPLTERENIDKSLIIKSIEVYGNENISTKEIIKEVPFKIGSYFSKDNTLRGKENILATGNFRDVKPEVLKYKNGVYVKYNVLENPVIRNINILENTLISDQELLNDFKTKNGEVYNIKILREDIDSIMKKYQEAGYLLANIYDMSLDKNFDLNIKISEGILRDIKYEKIQEETELKIVGNKNEKKVEKEKITQEGLKTKKYILEREVKVTKGKPIKTNEMKDTMSKLFRLGYFKDIKHEFKRDPQDPQGVILVLKFDERKSGAISGGVSYGSEVGLVGNISIQDNNFLGEAKDLKASFEMSSENERTYELSYSDPWIKGTNHLSFSTSLYKKEIQNSDDTYTNKTGFALSGGKRIKKNVSVKLGTKYEIVKEYDENKKIKKDGEYSILELYPSIYYDTRNNYINATKGEYGRLSFVEGLKFGDETYSTIELELRKYHNFLFKKNTMAYRMVIGGATDSTPEAQQFYTGGGNTLRGFGNYEYLGKHEFYLNIENRYNLNDDIDFVLFFDTGKSWDYFDDFVKFDDIKKGYGIGIRANTPIGPLRFDYGWPIGEEDTKGKFYFNMGQMF